MPAPLAAAGSHPENLLVSELGCIFKSKSLGWLQLRLITLSTETLWLVPWTSDWGQVSASVMRAMWFCHPQRLASPLSLPELLYL